MDSGEEYEASGFEETAISSSQDTSAKPLAKKVSGLRRSFIPKEKLNKLRSRTKLNEWTKREQEQDLSNLLAWRLGEHRGRQIAKSLMRECDTFPEVLNASPYRLSRVPGVSRAVLDSLATIRSIAEKLAFERLPNDRPLLASWTQLVDYLHVQLAHRNLESFHVLFLDKKNRLIADEVHQHGTVDHTPVYPREIIKRSLELSATALILAHNHPSGDPAPSSMDVRITREVIAIAKSLGIVVHDHIIISKSGHVSLRQLKLI